MVAKIIAKKLLFIHKPTDYKWLQEKNSKIAKRQIQRRRRDS